jgi:drug/metabolite transporter (DMT)-like permease
MASPIPSSFQDNLRGAAFMVASMFSFAVNDTVSKSFGSQLPVGEFMLVRGLFATTFILLVAIAIGPMRPLHHVLKPMIALRSLGEAAATVAFLAALWHMPIANVSAVMQALPLAMTVAAALLFGETIGWRRIAAILAGLFGVLVILRPASGGFGIYAFYLVFSVAACVVRDLATRRMGESVPAFFLTFATALAVTITGGAIALGEPLSRIGGGDLVWLAGGSLFLVAGYHFSVLAMRVGDIGFVAPFRYSVLLFSIAGGMVAFGEIPDWATLAGAAIVVAAGVYTFHRERLRLRQAIGEGALAQ